ncbi:MAG TPA: hypothetical protein VF123_15235 [Candidatus Sulfotelmatobacter sp.]
MRYGKLIAGLALGGVILLTFLSLTAYHFVKRAFGNAYAASQPASGISSKGAASNQGASTTLIAPPPFTRRGDAMAQAFRSGKLPTPLPQPTGTPEQAAAELAKRVIAEDEQSTAALLTAVQMSGFSVRADDGSLAYGSVTPGQGIMIDSWEVAALAKLFGDEMQIKLTDLSNAFASSMPALKNAAVDKLFLDGLRAAAQGNQPAKRFWADFIAELGRQSQHSYDLLSPYVDTGKVDLDVIQLSLILRRLAADLIIQEGSNKQKGQSTPLRRRDWAAARWDRASYDEEAGTQPYIGDAVWHPERGPRIVLVQEGGGSNLPCTLTEFASKLMDGYAYVSGKTFDALLEQVEKEGAENYGKATSKANAVLALIKLIAFYACLETDVAMGGDPPLVRTQNIYQPGERRTLTGTVRENTKNWQAVNCTRLALNGANLDISLPNDGPVAGVKTQWMLAKGGNSVTGKGITWGIVEFVSPDGTPLIQSAMVPISNPAAPKTNEEGHTTIDLEGMKQREPLSNPVPVMKEAQVNFSVAAKAVSMSQDLIDAAGNGVSFSKGNGFVAGPLTIGIGGLVETLLRSNIHLSKTLTIPVKDWVSCHGGWGGTISYQTTSQSVQTWGDAYRKQTDTVEETLQNEITLQGDPNVVTGWSGTSHGTYSASYSSTSTGVIVYPKSVITTIVTLSGDGDGEATADISSNGDNIYTIHAISPGNLQGNNHWHSSCMGDVCPHSSNPPDKDSPFGYSMMGISFTVKADPDHPGVLSGGAELADTPSKGQTTKAHWSLDQCQGGQ